MFNLKNRERLGDPREGGKAGLKPALYDPPGSLAKPAPGVLPRQQPPAQAFMPPRESAAAPAVAVRDEPAPQVAPAMGQGSATPAAGLPAGSKLFVGPNIKLKGVEISDCDVLVIEGHVEASVHSKAMQIAKPGTLTGTALVDIAEVHGEFTGELTARARLVVHGTGRVSGTIRYGQLVVAEGGEVTGDVKPVEASTKAASPARSPAPDVRHPPLHPRGPGAD